MFDVYGASYAILVGELWSYRGCTGCGRSKEKEELVVSSGRVVVKRVWNSSKLTEGRKSAIDSVSSCGQATASDVEKLNLLADGCDCESPKSASPVVVRLPPIGPKDEFVRCDSLVILSSMSENLDMSLDFCAYLLVPCNGRGPSSDVALFCMRVDRRLT